MPKGNIAHYSTSKIKEMNQLGSNTNSFWRQNLTVNTWRTPKLILFEEMDNWNQAPIFPYFLQKFDLPPLTQDQRPRDTFILSSFLYSRPKDERLLNHLVEWVGCGSKRSLDVLLLIDAYWTASNHLQVLSCSWIELGRLQGCLERKACSYNVTVVTSGTVRLD